MNSLGSCWNSIYDDSNASIEEGMKDPNFIIVFTTGFGYPKKSSVKNWMGNCSILLEYFKCIALNKKKNHTIMSSCIETITILVFITFVAYNLIKTFCKNFSPDEVETS